MTTIKTDQEFQDFVRGCTFMEPVTMGLRSPGFHMRRFRMTRGPFVHS